MQSIYRRSIDGSSFCFTRHARRKIASSSRWCGLRRLTTTWIMAVRSASWSSAVDRPACTYYGRVQKFNSVRWMWMQCNATKIPASPTVLLRMWWSPYTSGGNLVWITKTKAWSVILLGVGYLETMTGNVPNPQRGGGRRSSPFLSFFFLPETRYGSNTKTRR